MHGFPDNLHIHDYLIPHLVARGRRVVAFDFLGFGESAGATYGFGQQLGDLKAVVDALGLEKIILVAKFIRETRRQCKRGVDLIKIADFDLG